MQEHIERNWKAVQAAIHKACYSKGRDPQSVKLIAISKFQSLEDIMELYRLGCRDFGESRVAALIARQHLLPQDIHWHLIGTLQSNKVSKIVGRVDLIHSVDSVALAKKISESSSCQGRISSVLIQVNISREASKQGFYSDACLECMDALLSLPGIRIQGLMTMAPICHDPQDGEFVRNCFKKLSDLLVELHNRYPEKALTMNQLSMGMSQDYIMAVQEGSTLVRVGSALFKQDAPEELKSIPST